MSWVHHLIVHHPRMIKTARTESRQLTWFLLCAYSIIDVDFAYTVRARLVNIKVWQAYFVLDSLKHFLYERTLSSDVRKKPPCNRIVRHHSKVANMQASVVRYRVLRTNARFYSCVPVRNNNPSVITVCTSKIHISCAYGSRLDITLIREPHDKLSHT